MSPWETQLRKGVVELAVLAWIARGRRTGIGSSRGCSGSTAWP